MKKIYLLLFLIIIFSVTGCTDKWQKDNSDFPQEFIQKQINDIDNAKEKLSSNSNDISAMHVIALAEQELGNYKDAVKMYKNILELDPSHYASLNNLADIYEQVEDYQKASMYIRELFRLHPDSYEVISDTVRILTKSGQQDEARKDLETFMVKANDNTPAYNSFINGLLAIIQRKEDK